MRKILVAINAANPDKNSLEFAGYLGRLTNSKITGVFLENLAYEETLNLKASIEKNDLRRHLNEADSAQLKQIN